MDRGRQAGLVHAVCHRCWTTHPESNSNSNPPPQHTRPGPLAPRPSLRPRRLPPIRMPAHGVLSARPPGPPRPSSAPRRSQSPPAPSPASPPHVPASQSPPARPDTPRGALVAGMLLADSEARPHHPWIRGEWRALAAGPPAREMPPRWALLAYRFDFDGPRASPCCDSHSRVLR